MKYPGCESLLIEEKVSGIRIDICGGFCGGLWLALSQVKKNEQIKKRAGSKLLLFDKAEGVKIYRGAEHPCPQCKTTLFTAIFLARKII